MKAIQQARCDFSPREITGCEDGVSPVFTPLQCLSQDVSIKRLTHCFEPPNLDSKRRLARPMSLGIASYFENILTTFSNAGSLTAPLSNGLRT